MSIIQDYKEQNKSDLYKKYTYFIGSVVTYSDRGTKNLLLIDGQQRTTTICLILIALRDLLDAKNLISTDDSLCEKISDRLISKYDKSENRLKLKPINKDYDVYQSLVFKKDLNLNYKNSNIYNNYQIVKKYIISLCNNGRFTIDDFWEALRRLEFVWIELTYGTDNPHKIFESLNATGAKLEDGDLIRNYVLMNVPPDNQNEYYIRYWREIEENCQNQKLTEFLKYYLVLETKKYVSDKDVYKEFKHTYPEFNEDILKYITYLSKIFFRIKNSYYDKELNTDYLYILDFIKFGTSLSLQMQMQIINLYDKNLLSKLQTNKCLELLESYFVRRKICGLPTNALNKIMPVIVKNLNSKTSDDYVEALENNLSDTKYKFPSDKNFEEALKTLDLYSTKNFCNYFLARIEKISNREAASLKNIIYNNKIQIEHIFPQQSIRWKKEMPDDDYNYLKNEKLHSLGNLTLTAYNQDLSNKTWFEKKEIFIQSAYIGLNIMLKTYENWNKETLIKRENTLIEKSLDIWRKPLSTIKNNINTDIITNVICLSDDPTHTKPCVLSWNNKEISVKFWSDVLIEIIEDIYDNNPEKFLRLIKQGEFGKIISFTSDTHRKPHKLDNNIFLETHGSSKDIFKSILKIITYFDEFNYEDILIEVKTIQEQETSK